MVVEGEAELEQEAALQDAGRDRRVADRAEQDGVVLLQRVEVGVGEGLTGGVVAPGAEVELLGLQLHILREDGGEDLETLGHDLLADAVTGDHCEIECCETCAAPYSASHGMTRGVRDTDTIRRVATSISRHAFTPAYGGRWDSLGNSLPWTLPDFGIPPQLAAG